MYGLMRLAKSAPAAAELQLPQYATALGMNEAERGKVLYEAALWTVASYDPDSARRLNAVPESAYDEKLHEWRVREAMARGDWRAALAAIRKMPKTQREDSRWQYFEGRLAEQTGDKAGGPAPVPGSGEVGRPSTASSPPIASTSRMRCAPGFPTTARTAEAAIARDPAIVRAMELWKLERVGWATSEWNSALARFDDTQRRIAVEVARDNGWFDRAVFSLGKAAARAVRKNCACTNCASRCTMTPRIRREAASNKPSTRPGSRPRSAPKASSIPRRAPAPMRWA